MLKATQLGEAETYIQALALRWSPLLLQFSPLHSVGFFFFLLLLLADFLTLPHLLWSPVLMFTLSPHTPSPLSLYFLDVLRLLMNTYSGHAGTGSRVCADIYAVHTDHSMVISSSVFLSQNVTQGHEEGPLHGAAGTREGALL